MPAERRGRLVLVPNALDLGSPAEVDLRDVLPLSAMTHAAAIGHWVVENAKTARAFLKRVDRVVPLARSLQTLDIRELPRPRKGAGSAIEPTVLSALLAPALDGHDVGLLSEAGLPAVADPGSTLVMAAHAIGLEVLPLAGPSSLLLALAASGLNGQSFAFVGYLPIPDAERAQRIRELDQWSRRQSQTQIAIETPYRNAALLGALVEHLQPSTLLSVASALTLPQGRCTTMAVKDWRGRPPSVGDRTPAVYCWLAR